MTTQERDAALEQLTLSEARLLRLVQGLTAEQCTFRESDDRWSIADVMEHCVVFEEFIRGMIANALQSEPAPDKVADAPAKEPLVTGLANSRHTKFTAREATRPTGRWREMDTIVAELRKTRAATIAFVQHTQADLRLHFFPHIAFGDLDCYQWLMVLAHHSLRHALQIEEITASPGYPAA